MSNSETLANFIKAFNALKYGYHACPNNRGGVDIVTNYDGRLMASLLPRQSLWAIEKSTFSYRELLLMANLSAAMLGLRGGNDSGDETEVKMSKILSEKQKEVLMQARKNVSHYDVTEIIKNMDKLGNMQVKETDPLENWHKGQDLAGKLFLGSHYADIIAKAKTAAVFGKLLDMGLDPADLEAVINEVNNAD